MSPLDWALVETWKNAGVPLQAVLRGIDVAFEKWRGKKNRIQMVNSVAYCAQAVLAEAQIMAGVAQTRHGPQGTGSAPFSLEDLESYLRGNAADIRSASRIRRDRRRRGSPDARWMPAYDDLEDLERHLTALEDKLIAIARTRQTEAQLLEARRELDLRASAVPRQNDRRTINDAGETISGTASA